MLNYLVSSGRLEHHHTRSQTYVRSLTSKEV